MLNVRSPALSVVVAALLASCGGGGGGGAGSGTSMPTYTLAETSVSAQAMTSDTMPQSIVINYTELNMKALLQSGAVVTPVTPSGLPVESVETTVTTQSADQNTINGTITITLWPGSVLGAGTFTGNVRFAVCHNANGTTGCDDDAVAGPPTTIPVTLTVTGSSRPTTTASLSVDSLNLEAASAATSGASANSLTLTVSAVSPTPYLTFSQPAGGFVSSVSYTGNGTATGSVTITYVSPGSLSVGNHSELLSINVCLDADCDHPLSNSPIVIPVTYEVTASAGTNYGAQSVPVMANDIAWSGSQGKLYAVVSQQSATDPETLVEIDPNAATITRSLALTGNPQVLAVSDDGSYAYIGFSDLNIVERVALTTMTADINISLASSASTGPVYAGYLATVPSQPHSIVLATYANGPGLSSDNSEGVFVYDDLVPRVNSFGSMAPGPVLNSIAFGADAATLYAVEPNSENLSTLSLDSTGLSQVQVVGLGQIGFGGYLIFANGLLYDSDTRALNPSSGAVQGRFLTPGTFISAGLAADATLNRAYIFFQDQTLAAPTWTLETFDLQQMTPVALARTTGIVGPTQAYTLSQERVIRWGTQGLAINGELGVELISGAFVTQ